LPKERTEENGNFEKIEIPLRGKFRFREDWNWTKGIIYERGEIYYLLVSRKQGEDVIVTKGANMKLNKERIMVEETVLMGKSGDAEVVILTLCESQPNENFGPRRIFYIEGNLCFENVPLLDEEECQLECEDGNVYEGRYLHGKESGWAELTNQGRVVLRLKFDDLESINKKNSINSLVREIEDKVNRIVKGPFYRNIPEYLKTQNEDKSNQLKQNEQKKVADFAQQTSDSFEKNLDSEASYPFDQFGSQMLQNQEFEFGIKNFDGREVRVKVSQNSIEDSRISQPSKFAFTKQSDNDPNFKVYKNTIEGSKVQTFGISRENKKRRTNKDRRNSKKYEHDGMSGSRNNSKRTPFRGFMSENYSYPEEPRMMITPKNFFGSESSKKRKV
jgi:hypothetical protein